MSARPRIATVSLNPAIDQTAVVRDFTPGDLNRVTWHQSDAGGKGVNVACCLAHYGHPVAVTGLLGHDNADPFVRLFAERGLDDRFVRVSGQTRVNVKVTDDVTGEVTEVNFPGVSATPPDLDAVVAVLDGLVDEGVAWFVLSGSLPRGAPASIYRDLILLLHGAGGTVVLDASGQALVEAVAARPDIVKPNLRELGELAGRPLGDLPDILVAARQVPVAPGGLIAVSMGPRGALFVMADDVFAATVPDDLTIRSTVGAGDAMVAGLIHGAICGLNLEDRARLATGFSLAALETIGPRLPDHGKVHALADRVVVKRPGK